MALPPLVLTIIGIIQLVVKYVPEAKKIYDQARELFNMMFAGGMITAAQQKVLMDWADAHEAAVLAGEIPPELVVDPDPE
jgi:hypothetical protein